MIFLFPISFAEYCTTGNTVCISITTDSNNVNATMSLKVSKGIGWAAVGVGSSMTKTDMVIAWKNGKQIVASTRYSRGQIVPKPFKSKSLSNPQFKVADDGGWTL